MIATICLNLYCSIEVFNVYISQQLQYKDQNLSKQRVNNSLC
jgi:hypothetical protein